ncbi:hypothetical protein N7510_005758 [Penicillium lagena]|uniref:uncharacterized protein n=1 Tax=Penicillium lagena TaxID=94218 RepID=UPI002541B03A|nr:uncharacterized protein N7510_005758 [Penicillium lagena]KAJ5612564.1 hypothetical protein N7510_005758 [Penicillium lagena]
MEADIPVVTHNQLRTVEHRYVDTDVLRTRFALALSNMYKAEVPLYGDLVSIVQDVNRSVLVQDNINDSVERITLERHGAIRLGSPYELHIARRIFGLLGMHPVGYYDLSIASLPMHATCFRPRDAQSLAKNPFRVFTTLLRPELLESPEARERALSLLQQRKIFSDTLLDVMSIAESKHGRFTYDQAEIFIDSALETFCWQSVAAATFDVYNTLKEEHPVLADIVCFQTAHINHLTPRTLDIGLSQLAMQARGMEVKDTIEGPPKRECPILLRQTSFLAIQEAVSFASSSNQYSTLIDSYHKARFGEIEERGAALTPTGRKLYDELFDEAMEISRTTGQNVDKVVAQVFTRYPDTWAELRQQRLIYCEFIPTGKFLPAHLAARDKTHEDLLEELLLAGIVTAVPITYEDFLPFSAAGIFQSNLGNPSSSAMGQKKPYADQEGFEKSLGCAVLDSNTLYASIQRKSIEKCAQQLGLNAFDLLTNLS